MEHVSGHGADIFTICAGAFNVDTLSTPQLRFAIAETLAHLDLLERRGRVLRSTHVDRVIYLLGTREGDACALPGEEQAML